MKIEYPGLLPGQVPEHETGMVYQAVGLQELVVITLEMFAGQGKSSVLGRVLIRQALQEGVETVKMGQVVI